MEYYPEGNLLLIKLFNRITRLYLDYADIAIDRAGPGYGNLPE